MRPERPLEDAPGATPTATDGFEVRCGDVHTGHKISVILSTQSIVTQYHWRCTRFAPGKATRKSSDKTISQIYNDLDVNIWSFYLQTQCIL